MPEGKGEEHSLKSQNRKTAEVFENGLDAKEAEISGEEKLPRDELTPQQFDVEELLDREQGERYNPETRERQLDLGGQKISDEVELYLVEELGYDPDSDYFNIAGSVNIFEGDESIRVLYELDEDYTELENNVMRTPLIQFMDEELLETTIQDKLDYSMVSVENSSGLKVGFRYDSENYDPASEEVGKAIGWIEENIPDYEDSGR